VVAATAALQNDFSVVTVDEINDEIDADHAGFSKPQKFKLDILWSEEILDDQSDEVQM
jgi:hypothetical protein